MGWFGFNGGSAVTSTPRAAMAAMVTTISAAFGGFTWAMIDYLRSGKMSTLSVCCGILSGLVAITPACGFVATWAGAVMGITAGFLVNLSCRAKHYFGYDDTLDAFGLHGMGGVVGGIMTGILHQKAIPAMDGKITNGGALDGNWISLWYQTLACVTIAAWSFFLSYAILFVINKIPGLHLRITAAEELKGQDHTEIGEAAYQFHSNNSMVFHRKSNASGVGSHVKQDGMLAAPTLRIKNDDNMVGDVANEVKGGYLEV
jgi:Amt family ammonium transporter